MPRVPPLTSSPATDRHPAMLTGVLRSLAPLIILALAPIAIPGLLAESSRQVPLQPQAAAPGAACGVAGVVTAGTAKLPGVVITVTATSGGSAVVTSTGLDGAYAVSLPAPGRYELKAELAAFATSTNDVAAETPCQVRLDVAMTLASRVQAAAPPTAPIQAPAAGAHPPSAAAPARPAGPGSQRLAPGQFQRVGPAGNSGATGQVEQLSTTADDARTLSEHLNLPPGFSAETLSETVTAFGRTGQTNAMLLFGPGREGMF